MPIFEHASSGRLLLINYKVLYSLVATSPAWREVAPHLSPKVLMHSFRQGRWPRMTVVSRNPYERTISAFRDKFRQVPLLSRAPEFEWQRANTVFFPLLGIDPRSPKERIAERLQAVSLSEFIGLLPHVYRIEGHFQPQHWIRYLRIRGRRCVPMPACDMIRMENPDELATLPDIDLTRRPNSTEQFAKGVELSGEDRIRIAALYKRDFSLFSYAI